MNYGHNTNYSYETPISGEETIISHSEKLPIKMQMASRSAIPSYTLVSESKPKRSFLGKKETTTI